MSFLVSGCYHSFAVRVLSFPSRMTIGMLIESMAGKSGAIHGKFHDSAPFVFHDQQMAVTVFSEQLSAAGYEYYGSEPAL